MLSLIVFFTLLLLLSERLRGRCVGYETVVLLLFSFLGICIAVRMENLFLIYFGIELYAVCSYVLAGYKRDGESSAASIKYFNIGMLSSVFMMFGLSFIYGYGSTLNVYEIMAVNNRGQALGFALFFAGLMLKIGIVPFHMWVADVYQRLPTTVLPVFAVLGKVGLLVVFSHFMITGHYAEVLSLLAIFSMLIGSLGALCQYGLKRTLGFLTIASAGYAMIGLLISTETASLTLYMYLTAYAIAMFGVIAVISTLGGLDNFGDVQGLAAKSPLRALLLVVFLLSLAGLPPLAGFFAKFYLLREAMADGHMPLVITAIVASFLNFILAIRIIKVLYVDKGEAEFAPMNALDKAVIGIFAVATIGFIVFFERLMTLLQGGGL